jgi:hypothetical protein
VSLSKIINEMVKKSPNVGCDFLFVSMLEGLEMVKMFIERSFYFTLDTLNGSSTFLVVKMFLKQRYIRKDRLKELLYYVNLIRAC